MNPHDEFNKNIQKLMTLLEKLLKSQKQQPGLDLGELANKKNINLNLCIFNFLSMSPEDMEDMEEVFEDMYANGEIFHQHRSSESELKFELNAKDEDFLKSIGIRF
ncbi:MAG: hypothetical protein HZC17_07280 [Candidatus Omnitrophica bacterium]|nr:hypothetical protein [Candidatus Omnitrophota bacterium]